MPDPVVSKAGTVWTGDLVNGSGTTTLDSSERGTFDVVWSARAEGSHRSTNPEELLGAAHATCYAMALSHELTQNGTPPTRLHTAAEVTFVAGTGITGIRLSVNAQVDDISPEDFHRIAEAAKDGCPVSQALAATDITLDAALS